MNLKISTSDHPDQTLIVDPNGQPVKVRLKYSDAGDCWFLSLLSREGDSISSGRRIKSGLPILLPNVNGFVGNFIAVPITKVEGVANRNCWSNTHALYFVDTNEL